MLRQKSGVKNKTNVDRSSSRRLPRLDIGKVFVAVIEVGDNGAALVLRRYSRNGSTESASLKGSDGTRPPSKTDVGGEQGNAKRARQADAGTQVGRVQTMTIQNMLTFSV